jgi:hypothetical protein
MQESGIEAVAGTDGIDNLDRTRRGMPRLRTPKSGSSVDATLDDQQRNQLPQPGDGFVQVRLGGQQTGLAFVARM